MYITFTLFVPGPTQPQNLEIMSGLLIFAKRKLQGYLRTIPRIDASYVRSEVEAFTCIRNVSQTIT